MMDIINKKWLYFLFSAIIIIPGTISLLLWGVRPAIDFTGGTLLELQFDKVAADSITTELRRIISGENIEISSIQSSGYNSYLIRAKTLTSRENEKIQSEVKNTLGNFTEVRYESVGPSIGIETTKNAFKAIILASLAIILYITAAFWRIPKPYSSFAFGVCAVVALIHDVLVVIGLFSLLGHFYKVEVDSLFITALLTVMGFSVHDTIVVFDRIRENLQKISSENFSFVVNESIVQTLARSLSTSLTVIFTLVSLLLFGGETIRWFIAALLIGIISGTYSSIFNASPLLVIWEEARAKRKK